MFAGRHVHDAIVQGPENLIELFNGYTYSGHPAACAARPEGAVRPLLSARQWEYVTRVNAYVNATVKPASDEEVYGEEEHWEYPTTRGDCEDYALLKRKMLIQAGWPREALLMTVVRDKKGEGHAVLTVKTNRGEYILDNQEAEVLDWTRTGYKFVKRQSQADQNTWVALGEPRGAPATVSAR